MPGRWKLVAALIFACALAGCSEPKFYPARGKVIVFGVGPLTSGEVRFRPVSRPELIASGKVQKDGTFTLSTPGHGEGVLQGDCQAAIVVEPADGKSLIADRYADYGTADLQFTIDPREENFFIFDVKKAGR